MAATRYVVLLILALLFLLPFYVLLRNAFATSRSWPRPAGCWVPADPSLDNVQRLFATTTSGWPRAAQLVRGRRRARPWHTLVIAAIAAYGLARIPSRLTPAVLMLTMLTLMVPAAVTFVPAS